MSDEPTEVLRALWAADEATEAAAELEQAAPPKVCKKMKDVSFDGMAEPGSDLRTGLARAAARARASSSTSGEQHPRPRARPGRVDDRGMSPIRTSVAELTEALRARRLPRRPRAGHRAVRRALAGPAAAARGRGRGRQDRGRQGARRGARPPADPAAVLRGHRHQPGALRVGLRPADAADPGAVRAVAATTRPRSTRCSGRSSCSSGRCSRRCAPATGAVLLIDEVDRADDEFEAFLLELLSDFQITIPEIGTIEAEQPPLVVLTSNRTRELHDALKRRCLYHWVGYPSAEREVEIVLVRAPGVSEALARKVVAAVNRLRELDLAKPPGVAETIDWVRTLGVLGADRARRRDRRGHPRRGGQGPRRPRASCATTSTSSPPVADDAVRRDAGRLRARAARRPGCRSAPATCSTYCAAMAPLDPTDLLDLYWAGRTTLVTRRDQIPIYDRVFRAFFLDEPGEPDRAATRSPSGAAEARGRRCRCPSPSRPAEEREEQRGPARAWSPPTSRRCRRKSFAACTPEELAALRRIMRTIRLTPPRRRTRRTTPAAGRPRARTCAGRSARRCARTASRPSCTGASAGCGCGR